MVVVSCSMSGSPEAASLEEMNRALDSLGMLSRPALTDMWLGTPYVRPHYRDKAAKAVLKEVQKRNKQERKAEVQCRHEEALAKSKKNGTLRKRNVYNTDGTRRGKHSSSAPRKTADDNRCSVKDSGQEGPCEAEESFWDELEEEEAESMYMWNGSAHERRNDLTFGVEEVVGDGGFEYPVAAPPEVAGDDEELRLALQLSSMEFQEQMEEERREAALLQEHLLGMQPADDDADLLLAIELSKQDLEAAQGGGRQGSRGQQASGPPGLHYRGPARERGQACMLDSVDIGDEVEIEPEPARSSVVKIRTRGTVQEIVGWDPSTGDLRVVLEGGVVGSLRSIITV